MVKFIAHAGNQREYPENSLPAFRNIPGYVWGAENDMLASKDHIWVLMHDLTIDRTTDGTGYVQDLTYDQLRSYRLDTGQNIENLTDDDKVIPSFDEYLEICAATYKIPMIELKSRNYSDEAYQNLFKSLGKYQLYDRCILISFDKTIMQKLRSRCTSIEMYWIPETLDQNTLDFCKKNNIGADIFWDHVSVTKENIDKFHDAGLKVGVWTPDKTQFDQLIEKGVDLITTDDL